MKPVPPHAAKTVEALGNQSKATTGQMMEDLACRELCRAGLRLITRNYRCRGGEIDLVMQDGEDLVCVEVRYRRSDRFGTPAETVTATKRARLLRAARHYLLYHASDVPVRFDVVAIAGPEARIDWIRNAFTA